MSDWIVENVRFTLFDKERKERVIVQKSNGDLTVTSKQRDDDGSDEKPESRAKAEAPPKAKAAARAATREKAPKTETAAAPPAAGAPKNVTALEWAPIVDAGYDGFAAKSHGAEIHVLKTSSGGWATYVYWGRGVMKHIVCHAKLEDARKDAQTLHDTGLPPRPESKLTQEMIDNACAGPKTPPRRTKAKKADAAGDEAGAPKTSEPQEATKPPRKPKTKKAEATTDDSDAKSAPAPTNESGNQPAELTPEVRSELRKSFTDAVVEAMKQAE